MSIKLFARLAVVNPKTSRISLTREFIEVSEHDISTMTLPDHVVRVDLFSSKTDEKPSRRILMGVHKVYEKNAVEDEFGPMFADHLNQSGASQAAFISNLGKLIPVLPGDEIIYKTA